MKKILLLGACCLLLIFLWWHWRLGMTRYFDVDEFAHLSWGYQMRSGARPYVDFLFFFPPGFHLFLTSLFAFGAGVTPLLAGRVFAFVVFVLLTASVILLYWQMRKSHVAILAGVFLAFLPMPFDKFLEIRPDTLAVLFAMTGMTVQAFRLTGRGAFWAGICYGASLLVLPKTLPQVGFAVMVEWLRYLFGRKRGGSAVPLKGLIAGLGIPLTLFALWTLTLGNIDQVWYSLTRLPVEANKISETFIMMPDLFFYPNTTFYGSPGWDGGLMTTQAIWILAIAVAVYRLVTSPPSWTEFLISGTFFVHVMTYVLFVPLKHTQYLIPASYFVAIYAADAVGMLWADARKRPVTASMFAIGIMAGGALLYHVFVSVNRAKLAWTNQRTLENLTRLYRTIPPSEYVLDLTGETIYYRHPYPVCCIPFGQSGPYLSRPLPDLVQTLEKTQTKYIFQGEVKRVSTLLPQDQAYISKNYLPHSTISDLLVRK